MAKLFLDANIFIDLIEGRQEIDTENLIKHELIMSPLSMHILIYLYKYKIPNEKLLKPGDFIQIVPFSKTIMDNALLGPTDDFEDNIQLHSAAAAHCDSFLTSDKKLLKMGLFGALCIVDEV